MESNDASHRLVELIRKPGAFEAFACLLHREIMREGGFISVAKWKGFLTDDPERLLDSEIALISGALMQNPSFSANVDWDQVISSCENIEDTLRELHDELNEPLVNDLFSSIGGSNYKSSKLDTTNDIGLAAREPIFYSSQSALGRQFMVLAKEKYQKDSEWLLKNLGINIDEIINIAEIISEFVFQNVEKDISVDKICKENFERISKSRIFTIENISNLVGNYDKTKKFLEIFSSNKSDFIGKKIGMTSLDSL